MESQAFPAEAAAQGGDDPIHIVIERQPEYNKALALIRSPLFLIITYIAWILMLLPHILALVVLEIGMFFAYVVAFIAVLVTGRYPRGLFDYMVGVIQWAVRLQAWIFILTDEYPPFSFDPDAHPVKFQVDYPESVPRWRAIPLLSGILAIPLLVVAYVLLYIAQLLLVLPPVLPGVIPLMIVATGQYPEGLFNLVSGGLRMFSRGQAYALFLVRPYPPFTLE
jgi:hypothetical protein